MTIPESLDKRKPCPTHGTPTDWMGRCDECDREQWNAAHKAAEPPQDGLIPVSKDAKTQMQLAAILAERDGKLPEPPQDVAGTGAWLRELARLMRQNSPLASAADGVEAAAAALAAMAKERDDLAQQRRMAVMSMREQGARAEQAERERDEARKLLLRWLQAHNKMDGRDGLTIAEFDKLRQETHDALRGQ